MLRLKLSDSLSRVEISDSVSHIAKAGEFIYNPQARSYCIVGDFNLKPLFHQHMEQIFHCCQVHSSLASISVLHAVVTAILIGSSFHLFYSQRIQLDNHCIYSATTNLIDNQCIIDDNVSIRVLLH